MMTLVHPLISAYLELVAVYASSVRQLGECPVCGGIDFLPGTADVVRLKGCEVYLERPDRLVVCDTCGLLQRPHVFPPGFYFDYLNAFYDCVPDAIGEMSRWKATMRRQIVRRYVDRAHDILEVSSYDGATLAELRHEFGASVVGVEPTTGAARLSEAILAGHGARVVNDVIERAWPALDGSSFDVVLFSHAFRHVSAPDAALGALCDVTAPEALVVVDESDLLDLMSLHATPELLVRSLHVQKQCYYTFHNLVFLFERFGFALVGRHLTEETSQGIPYCALVFRKIEHACADRTRLAMARLASQQALGLYRSVCTSPEQVRAALLKWG
jgi:SAM-dependent methyltransferase